MFDSGTKVPGNRIHLYDPVGLINDGYGGYRPSNYAVRPRRPTMSYDHGAEEVKEEGLVFAVETVGRDECDISATQLWKPTSATSSKAMIPKTMNPSLVPLHHHTHHNYHPMSPSSRTQAIASGRRELMDMVRDMPETFYELSLKDIVEHKLNMEDRKEIGPPEEKRPVKEVTKQKKGGKNVRKSESKKKMVRNRSIDNGKFLLKTSVFPILGSKKSKKSLAAVSSFKIAPMPKPEPISTGSMKVGEKDWWKRRSCISSESDDSHGLSSNSTSRGSSSSSNRSNSSNGRRSSRFLPSCFLFNGRRVTARSR